MNRILLAGFATLIMSASLHGQGFVNLDFESARVIPTTNGIAASDALPGWSVYLGMHQQSSVQYNINPIAFNTRVALIGSNSSVIDGILACISEKVTAPSAKQE